MKKNLTIAALVLALLLGAAFQSPNSVQEQLKAIQSQLSNLEAQNASLAAQVASIANKVTRQFYLTKTLHTGAQALSACDAGYHMASLWEIHDPTNLRYNTELGFTLGDSGFGPPSLETARGWIRTGLNATPGNNLEQMGNCNAWTSASGVDIGNTVFPSTNWGLNGDVVEPWTAGATTCNTGRPVWCVQD